MRAPLALDWSPAPSTMTPAFTSSSLNFAIAPSISSEGILPASESLLALTITMKRIVFSFRFRGSVIPGSPAMPFKTNEDRDSRHAAARIFRFSGAGAPCGAAHDNHIPRQPSRLGPAQEGDQHTGLDPTR